MNHQLRRMLVVSALVAAVLVLIEASGAWAANVDPNQGSIGTTFTITGTGFGPKGQVTVGNAPVTILSWSPTLISCQIKAPMGAGTYNVVVNPQGKTSKTDVGSFTIMLPSVDPPRPRPAFVTSGQHVVLTGAYFGTDKRLTKVEIESFEGVKLQCKIINWTDDAITVLMPSGILGIFNLIVTNQAGTATQPWWGTFAAAPAGAIEPPGGYTFSGFGSYSNATGVMYQNQLWVFWSWSSDADISWRIYDGESWSSVFVVVDTDGNSHYSYAQVNPIVINNYLYLFETRRDGNIHVTKYDPMHVDPITLLVNPVWISQVEIPISVYNVNGRYAAVYNEVINAVEIYITPNNTTIEKVLYYPDTNKYDVAGNVPIQLDPAHPTVNPYLTAVWNGNVNDGTSVTYLSWSDGYAGALTELKDMTVLYQYRIPYWNSRSPIEGPTLVDLTEKYLAVMYNHWDTHSSYQKYDKDSHTIVGGDNEQNEIQVAFDSPKACDWAPNGVTYFKKVDDPNSPTGSHMEMRMFAIVEDYPKASNVAFWEIVETEYLGYWMPTGEANLVDFQGGNLTGDAVNQRLAETFPSWPIIGLIDMPPYVMNGNGLCLDVNACGTSASLDFTVANTTGLSGTYSVGGYVASGRESPVTVNISSGYTGGFSNSTTFSYTVSGGISGNVNGRVVAYYLVPSFNVWTLEWFDLNGIETGIYTQALEANPPAIRKEAFAPDVGPDSAYYNGQTYLSLPYMNVAKTLADISDPAKYPMHAYTDDTSRLRSYSRNPTFSPFDYISIVNPSLSESGWAVNSLGGFTWTLTQTSSVDNGWYSNIKIGPAFKNFGFGVEGSVKIMVSTKNQIDVKAITTLKNLAPIDNSPSRITSFAVEGYWLKPADDAYWTPVNRQTMGDTPWFITYRVIDFHHPNP